MTELPVAQMLQAPAMRTISLARDVWNRETSYLNDLTTSFSAANVVTSAAAEPTELPVSVHVERSIFGFPVLSCCTLKYRIWSSIILLLDLTYSAFILPISIGFQVNDLQINWACVLDLTAGTFFFVELILGFHVGYMATSSGRKQEILDGKKVAKYYICRGTFLQDLTSTIIWIAQIILLIIYHSGVQMPSTVNAFQVVRIVRMVRFLPIMRSIFSMTISSGNSSIIPGLKLSPIATHIINIFYSGLVLINFFGCLWNFIAIKEEFENTWMNNVGQLIRDYSSDGTSMLTPEELSAIPGPRRWLTGFYFTIVTIATLGYGDIVPSTAAETAVSCFVIGFGVLMFGIIMGSIAEQISNSSRESRQAQSYRAKMAAVNSWIRNSNLPKALKAKVNAFYAEVWVKHASNADATQIFYELPHKLRQEIAWEMNKDIFQQLSIFEHLEEAMRSVLSSFMAPVELSPGQELTLRGDVADRFWVLHEGEMQVIDSDHHVVRTVKAPAVVGESALLQHNDSKYCVRPHGLRSHTGCTLWEVQLRDLMPFLLAHPDVMDVLTVKARGHLTRESVFACELMCKGPLLGKLPLSDQHEGHSELKHGEVFISATSHLDEGGGRWGCQEEQCADTEIPVGSENSEEWRPRLPGVSEDEVFEERQAVDNSAAQIRSVHIAADARFEAEAPPDPYQPDAPNSTLAHDHPDSPVKSGELYGALEALRLDIAGRLQGIEADMHRAVRMSTAQAAIPMWAGALSDRRQSSRQLVDRRTSPTPGSPLRTSVMRWNYGQIS